MAAWGCRGAAVNEDRRWSGAGATGAGAGGVDGDKHAGRRRGGGGQTHGHGPRPTAHCRSRWPRFLSFHISIYGTHPQMPTPDPSGASPIPLRSFRTFRRQCIHLPPSARAHPLLHSLLGSGSFVTPEAIPSAFEAGERRRKCTRRGRWRLNRTRPRTLGF